MKKKLSRKLQISLPPPMYEWALKQARIAAAPEQRKPSISAFLSKLIFQHKEAVPISKS